MTGSMTIDVGDATLEVTAYGRAARGGSDCPESCDWDEFDIVRLDDAGRTEPDWSRLSAVEQQAVLDNLHRLEIWSDDE